MKPNTMLEEICRIKNELASEARDDVHHLSQHIRKWVADYSHPGPAVQNGEQLQHLAAGVTDSARMLLWSFEFASHPSR